MILVFGIIGLVACMPLGIVAWVMGNGDLKKMDAGTMDPEGRSNTNVGRILGMISTILAIIVFILWILMIALAVALPAIANSTSLLV